jgi:hypothetical protein
MNVKIVTVLISGNTCVLQLSVWDIGIEMHGVSIRNFYRVSLVGYW